MIFVAVGTQLPFDRLIRAVDDWCAQTGRGQEVFGQIGHLGADNYRPEHFEWAEMIGADAFRDKVEAADMIVSHAGMGSIITAMSSATPVIVLPRRAHLGEQRNDHQFATVKRLGTRPGIFPIMTEEDLPGLIDRLFSGDGLESSPKISSFAQNSLIDAVRDFIHGSSRSD
jgi:exopolysaccharide biosynthesis glucuronosyltransferase PssE